MPLAFSSVEQWNLPRDFEAFHSQKLGAENVFSHNSSSWRKKVRRINGRRQKRGAMMTPAHLVAGEKDGEKEEGRLFFTEKKNNKQQQSPIVERRGGGVHASPLTGEGGPS